MNADEHGYNLVFFVFFALFAAHNLSAFICGLILMR